jgi:formamidopyrimidine-DNA glycosylase
MAGAGQEERHRPKPAGGATLPELPEVETIRRTLEPYAVGRDILGLTVRDVRLRTPIDPAALEKAIVGRRVEAVSRRSKYLLVHLSGSRILVVHLGMSGRLVLEPPDSPCRPHTHVRLRLDGDRELRYSDPRRFGMLFVVDDAGFAAHPRFAQLGPEPLESDFDVAYLVERARGVRKPIKNFLMDASVVVGVGNIYACEALHRARVHPRTAARRLSAARWRAVHAAVRSVLQRAVRDGGTTFSDFRDATGRNGTFQRRLRVYGRAGEACRRCGRSVRRIVQAGRSTFYCPGCQH